ncbi:hypothetical protein ACPFUK_002898 [Vibrio cholerae]|uniref:hypothetical protein n=1 Tax=Vibrio cholerae TaxID=666 RepID=UPI0011D3CA6E|nr:hypothetical protein [Vibrio cholerae]ELL3752078.1 hypothetical protein [Vibrio cholerae]TXX84636.1 hypothetical protein FXE94_07215 [Vibrio cholerae]GHY54067.1 hypothetical protein VCSRO119_3099 [Vibrio cholerae]GIA62361.1 hypothetical protein VCSRO87_3116 [Vibrio cholerae]
MNMKSCRVAIALALITPMSFSALANNVVSGSEVIADADIVVNTNSSLSFTVTPVEGLTVADIKQGAKTNVATLNLTGSNLALRMVNAIPDYPYCTVAVGTNNSDNTAEFCFGGDTANSFVDSGNTYYKVSEGTNYLRSGNDNGSGKYKVGADTYKVTMELVEYTL